MPSFLLVGLAWSELAHLPSPPGTTPAQFEARLRAGLDASVKEFEAAGAEVALLNAAPSNSDEEVKTRLAERKWDGIVIGAGIRTLPPYTHLFERIVNAAREVAPQATLVFNTKPDDTIEAVRRWFPDM